jgi:hypothetical protein
MRGRQGRSRDQGLERDRGRTTNRRRTRDRKVATNRRWMRVECHRRTGIILTHSGEGERSSLRRAAQSGWSEERLTDRNLHPDFHSSLPPPSAQDLPKAIIAKKIHTRCYLRDTHVGRRDWRQRAGSSTEAQPASGSRSYTSHGTSQGNQTKKASTS